MSGKTGTISKQNDTVHFYLLDLIPLKVKNELDSHPQNL